MAGSGRPSMTGRPDARTWPADSTPDQSVGSAADRRREGKVAGGRGPRPIRPLPTAPAVGRPGERSRAQAGALAQRSRGQAGALVDRSCQVPVPRGAHPAGRALRRAVPVRIGVARLPDRRVIRRRRLVAMVGVGLAALLVVVALGLLAAAARSGSVPERSVSVQVAPGESLWQIARRTAPNANVDAVVERIVTQNGLASAVVRPGQVLSVPSGPAG